MMPLDGVTFHFFSVSTGRPILIYPTCLAFTLYDIVYLLLG